jgi:hypothetical protein
MKRRAWLAATCAWLAMACASSKSTDTPPTPEAVEDSHAIVQNDYLGDIEVFLVTGAIRSRLGRVSTGGKVSFVIPARFMVLPELYFHVTLAAATTSGFSYPPIIMSVGSTVELHVNRVLTNSTYQVRGP